jgi:hypothetical protein
MSLIVVTEMVRFLSDVIRLVEAMSFSKPALVSSQTLCVYLIVLVLGLYFPKGKLNPTLIPQERL